MELLEVVRKLDDIESELTIYARRPWSIKSKSEVAFEPDDGSYPPELESNDLEYFIEVFIAKDFLFGWSSGLNKIPTIEEKAIRLISYAENDA